jgi:hypothetical protein
MTECPESVTLDEGLLICWIPTLENHYASTSDGRIYSAKSECFLQPFRNGQGYLRVALYVDGRKINRTVHSLVAACFLGPRPDGRHVNHIDGNKANNRRENLEYVTPLENALHQRVRCGGGKVKLEILEKYMLVRTSRQTLEAVQRYNAEAKLLRLTFPRVFELKDAGYTQRAIAKELGASQHDVWRVLKGKATSRSRLAGL